MVSGKDDIRYFASHPDLRPRILGVLEEVSLEGLIPGAVCIVQYPWHQAAHGIDEAEGRQLPTGQDEVPDGNFIRPDFLDDPLVYALIVAAEDDDIGKAGVVAGQFLIERLPLGRHEDGSGSFRTPVPDGLVAVIHGLSLHDHARPAPVWIIIHLPVGICGIVPDIDGFDGNQALLLRPAQNTGPGDGIDHFRKEGHDMKIHLTSPQSGAPS